MKVFLFEFATCFGNLPPQIVVEGLGMFRYLYECFIDFSDVHSFVAIDTDRFDLPRCDSSGNKMDRFREYLEKSDYALIIAPEDDYTLLNLTKIVEEIGTPNLGSSSKAVEITSDKWELYNRLKGKVNMPKTSLEPIDPPFVVKPRVSCGGEGIKIADTVPEGYIAQEFIKGIDLSVSLLVGDTIEVLSVNRQLIESFRYKGAIVPFDFKEEVIEDAIKAVECIKGLFGYVGVDVVLSSDGTPYVIEVNARMTTPAILFSDVYGINLAELLIRNYEGKEIPKIVPKRRMMLKKVERCADNSYVSYGGYSLVKMPY